MGFLDKLRQRAEKYSAVRAERAELRRSKLQGELKRKKAELKEKKQYYRERAELYKVKREIREHKLAPIRAAAGGLRAGLKELKARPTRNNQLFPNMKTSDELLGFSKEPNPVKKKGELKLKKKVVYDYR